MRFKIDENLPVELAELLRQIGHDAITVLEQHMGGDADSDLAGVCQQEGRVLVTLDMGFADIRTYLPEKHSGIMVLRLKRQDKASVLKVFRRIISMMETEPLAGKLWLVDIDKVRIRG